MRELEHSREGACKRRLHFGLSHATEVQEQACEQCPATPWASASPEHIAESPPYRYGASPTAGFGEHVLRSPTHDGGFTAATGSGQQLMPVHPGLLDTSSRTAAIEHANAGLAAAFSSSRHSLERLCSPPNFLATAAAAMPAADAASPAAAALAPLPPAPRKRSAEATGVSASGRAGKTAYGCARALEGMTPSTAAELQGVKAWLAGLEAR